MKKITKIILASNKMESFGEYIRSIRLDLNMTQTQFAAKIEVDSATISKIENGKKMPSEKLLPTIAKIYKVDLSELKEQYFSEKFANDLYDYKCPETALKVAERKLKYRIASDAKQSNLEL